MVPCLAAVPVDTITKPRSQAEHFNHRGGCAVRWGDWSFAVHVLLKQRTAQLLYRPEAWYLICLAIDMTSSQEPAH
jgi:hypothetical protein